MDYVQYEEGKGIPETLTIQKEIEPKANRMLLFNGKYYHTGHSPANHNTRVLINTDFN